MKVLDLFAGLEGWSEPFRNRGHEVISLDNDPRFECNIIADILDFDAYDLDGWVPDIILASPPCEKFSTLTFPQGYFKNMGDKKNKHIVPVKPEAHLAVSLVEKTVEIIEDFRLMGTSFWIIENPRAILRSLNIIPYERRTVTYCQYGAAFMKPTDLWGNFPPSLKMRAMCKNGDPCHISAPRGSLAAVQGPVGALAQKKDVDWINKNYRKGSLRQVKAALREHYGTSNHKELAALRAKIPYELSLEVCIAAENDLK